MSLIYADWRRCTTLQLTTATGLLFHVPTWPPVYEEHGPQQQTKFNIVLISDRQFLKFVSEHLTLTAKFILRSFGTLQRAGSFCPCMWPLLLPNKIPSLLSLFHEERMTWRVGKSSMEENMQERSGRKGKERGKGLCKDTEAEETGKNEKEAK